MKTFNQSTTLDILQAVNYHLDLPIVLHLHQQIIICQQLLRIVPKKRMVFLGTFNNKKVIIKLFIHANRAKKHWSREQQGSQLLSDKQITTPPLVDSGLTAETIYCLIFDYIEGHNLAQFWATHSSSKRYQQLTQMMAVLAQHHQAHLTHQDLHYANFLLTPESIYTLDGEEVRLYKNPLTKTVRLKNLALFLAQTFDLSKSQCLALLADYSHKINLKVNTTDTIQFWQWLQNYQQQRIQHYLKKIVRECTEVIAHQNDNQNSLCRRHAHNPDIAELLNHPEHYFHHPQSVFLKQGNTCTVKSVMIGQQRYVIKRYNAKGILYELRHIGQFSRAKKSWINAHLLRFIGVKTPEPIALIEQTPALGQRCSYFISQYQVGDNSWQFFCHQPSDKIHQQNAANNLLQTLQQLCQQRITHGDLKGSNLLIHQQQTWLIDLDGLQQHRYIYFFNQHWQRDKTRFLQNWEKKSCYRSWKLFFNQQLPL
jgi:tRNA A-37 threonylcarbamoyl transferase component Bud32